MVREKLKRIIEFTANLGGECLVIHVGRMDGIRKDSVAGYNAEYDEETRRCGKPEILRIIAENLHEAGEFAATMNVKLALENLDRFEPCANLRELPELIRLADSQSIGLCLDSGHAWCCGINPVKWIEALGDKLFTTHFHDNFGAPLNLPPEGWITSTHTLDRHLPPGFGTIDWLEIILALRRSGYAYAINFESDGWPGFDEPGGLRRAIDFWRTCELLAKEEM